MIGFWNVFPVLFIIMFIYLGQALWIYIDGKKRGDGSAILWATLALANFPIPLIIYLIITRSGKKKCINCGKHIDSYLKSCPYCGEITQKQCSECGYLIDKDWKFCPNCNKNLK